jgi:hypothetical protein
MIRLILAANVLLGAFLMFQIEPLVGKIVTAQFGGGASIWSACLMFFQIVLLFGYLLTLIISKLPVRAQAILYPILMVSSAVCLNSFAQTAWSAADQAQPIASILQLLTVKVGLPFLLLSTISGTIQNWYQLRKLGDPYPLYALSNAGSLLALLSYPTLLEPFLSVSQTLRFWTIGYWLVAGVSCLASVTLLFGTVEAQLKDEVRSKDRVREKDQVQGNSEVQRKDTAWALAEAHAKNDVGPKHEAQVKDDVQPTALSDHYQKRQQPIRDYLLWISLSALGSITLIAYTAYITQNVAPMPLLWVLPLCVYLVSFIVVFAGDRFNKPTTFAFLAPMLWLIGSCLPEWSIWSLLVDLGFIFCACCTCHGLIAASKPEPRHLPAFYLAIAIGGALGGVFENFVAPAIFNTYAELFGVLLAMIVICTILAMHSLKQQLSKTWLSYGYLLVFILVTVCGQILVISQHVLLRKRNFYGCITVKNVEDKRSLASGITLHGFQYLASEKRTIPTTYYATDTGFGATDFLLRERAAGKPLSYGLIGLGIGTIACYGQPGDQFTFYEIDPKVKEAAEEYFSFLRDSKASVKIILGDARISLKNEKHNDYDLLVVDAFSGDSIPVHLLTKEAMQIYAQQIKADGVILFHISNRHVMLEQVITKLAESVNLKAYLLKAAGSQYIAVTGTNLYDDPKQLTGRAQFAQLSLQRILPQSNFRCWTDDFSNLLSVVKF